MIIIKPSDLIINSKRWSHIPSSENTLYRKHTVGWVVKYNGKEYGDFVTISGGLSDDILKQVSSLFTEQANDTMIVVKGEQFIKDNDLDWRDFAMMKMQLKDDGSIKIQTKEETEASLERMLKENIKIIKE